MATTIQLEPETREKLKMIGGKGETYNEIILDLIATYEARLEELERRAEAPREEYITHKKLKKELGIR